MSAGKPDNVVQLTSNNPTADYWQPDDCTYYYYPCYYPTYIWDNRKVEELEAKIKELEEKLRLLEKESGMRVVERPRFEVVKKRRK